MKKQKIVGRLIIEVLGSPKEHIEKILEDVMTKLRAEKQVQIINENSYDAEQQENKLWSAFSEVEIEAPDLKRFMEICFDFTPSSVEILEPAGLTLDSNDVMEFINDVMARIHRYAMVIKNFQANNIVVQREMEALKAKVVENMPSEEEK